MKSLLILRHAKSSWADPSLDDHDRPLNARGQRDAPRMGALLVTRGLVPDVILCSSARRARETASVVARACAREDEVRPLESLYEANASDHLEALRSLPPDCERALIVGHNPEIESLVETLVGRAHRMPTAALAHVSLSIDAWSDLEESVSARLEHLWRPKELARSHDPNAA